MLDRVARYIWAYDAGDDQAPRSAWRHFLQIMSRVGRELAAGMITLRAMSLVYTSLLAIVPVLALSITVLKGFGVHDLLQPTLVQLLAPLGDKSFEISRKIVGFVDKMNFGVLGAVGLALLLYTVVSLILKVESAFNYTWRPHGKRRLIQRFADYLSVAIVGPVLVMAAVSITAALGSTTIVAWLDGLPQMNKLLHFGGKLLPFLLVIAAFTFIYLIVPNARVKPGSAFYGAAVAGFLWQCAGIVFTSFVGGSTGYTAIYSGLAILLVFMFWLYISWAILLIGASIAYYHQHPERLHWSRAKYRISARLRDQLALQAMLDVGRAHDHPEQAAPGLEQLALQQRLPPEVLQRLLDALEADGLLQRTAGFEPAYVPGAALERIRLSDILHSARRADAQDRDDEPRCDGPVGELLRQLEQDLTERLGESTLADLIRQSDGESIDENSFVQRQ